MNGGLRAPQYPVAGWSASRITKLPSAAEEEPYENDYRPPYRLPSSRPAIH